MRILVRAPSLYWFSGFVFFVLALSHFSFAAETEKPLTEEEKKKKEEEEEKKKKIPPLKYSSWCVFSELTGRTPKIEDPESHESRINAQFIDGFGRRGKWAHVVLDVQNTIELKKKAVIEGTASIVFNQVQANGAAGEVPYSTTYRQSFKVGPESENQYHFSILCPEYGWSSNVEMGISTAVGGLFTPSRFFKLNDLDQNREELIVVISETPGSFSYLGPAKNNYGAPENLIDDIKGPIGRKVASVAPSEVPERWQDLAIASLIIIDGPPAEALTAAQWDALKTYAQSGGKILIMAGKDPARLKGPAESLAGISARGVVELPSIDQFEPPYNGPKKTNPDEPAWTLPVVEVTAPNAGVVKRNSKTQIVEYTARSYGAGLVAFLPYSLTDRRLVTWHGRTTIPFGLMNREKNLFAYDSDEEDDAPVQNNPWGGWWGNTVKPITNKTLSEFRATLDKSFENDTPVVMQKPSTVLQFLLIYLICAVPVNFLVFTVFKRREAAWLATPALALVFTILAYYTSYSGQTGDNTVNEVTVLEAGPGQGEAVGRTFMGVYAPRRDDYHITFPPQKIQGELFDTKAAPGHLINQNLFEQRGIEFPSMTILDTGTRLDIESIRIQTRSTRRFEIQHRASLANGIELKTSASGQNGIAGTEVSVTNKTNQALIHPIFFKNDQYAPLKPGQNGASFSPGESFDSTSTPLQWRAGRKQAFEELAQVVAGRGKHVADRARALTAYLEAHSRQYPAGVLLAWMEGPALPVQIAGSSAREFTTPNIDGITLLVVPVAATNKGSRFGKAAFVPPSIDVTTFYNPANAASGEWKAFARNKSAFDAFDERGQACLYLRLRFNDSSSRDFYKGKPVQLTLTLGRAKNAPVINNLSMLLYAQIDQPGVANFAQINPTSTSTRGPQNSELTSVMNFPDLFARTLTVNGRESTVLKIVLPKANTNLDGSQVLLKDIKIDAVETK